MDRRLLRDTARTIRARSRSIAPPYSTRRIIAECFPTTIVTGRMLPDGIQEAVSIVNGEPVVLYHRKLPVPHQRFVIAHALAHVLWDLSVTRHTHDIEERADWFAAELLLPLDELEPLVAELPSDHEERLDAIDGIASLFKLPVEVVSWRIDELRMFGVTS